MIYLLRHAERIDQSKNPKEKELWSKSPRIKNNLYDIPLSLYGITQAYTSFGKILKNFTGKFEYIYCSPMTRCVQSALQFQKYILDQYKQLVLVRVEYGLAIHLFKENEIYSIGAGIKYSNDKFVVTKIYEFVDKYLSRDKIYKRYGSNRFDLGYRGICTREQINMEQTYTTALNSRINTIKKISLSADKSKLTIICAHCETCHLTHNYLNKQWINIKNAPKYRHVGGLKISVKSNKLTFVEMI